MVLDDSNWSEKAWMSKTDADLLEKALVLKGKRSKTSFDVLEWGSGKSTFYYTALLKRLGINLDWISLEYDREYYREEISPRIGEHSIEVFYSEEKNVAPGLSKHKTPRVAMVLFNYGKLSPFLEEHADDRKVVMDDYVEFPAATERLFDVVIIDGRKRRRCLLQATTLLKKDGIVILHDAYRKYYRCAFSKFKYQAFVGDILWVGTKQKEIIKTLTEIEAI